MTTTSTDQSHPFRDRIEVVLRGDLPEVVRGWAVDEVERAVTAGSLRLVRARVTLRRSAPATVPCRADITVDLDGHLIHGRSDARAPLAALHAAAGQVHALAAALARRDPVPEPVRGPVADAGAAGAVQLSGDQGVPAGRPRSGPSRPA